MNHKAVTVLLMAAMASGMCWAQTGLSAPAEDFQPASTNQPGRSYPQVNSEGRVRARIVAPDAKSVLLDIGGVRYPMTKGEDGAWIGDSSPQDEGFHYYQLNIDGAQVPDPGSMFFYGASRWGSGVEVPAKDQDFYALKNVPHGQLRENYYFSESTNTTRRCFVYTPPGYDQDTTQRYPVLYLQHGGGEDETGWGNQGRTSLIMDNLIAEGKAKPFIIVMDNGSVGGGFRGGARGPAAPGAAAPGGRGPGAAPAGGPGEARGARAGMGARGGFDFAAGFGRVLIEELIPYIEANYRTLTDQPNRAMAGLSMGGMQTRSIALANLDKFSHIGIFSGGSISPADVDNAPGFKDKVRLVFISYGSRERGAETAKANVDALKQAGINSVYYESPLTAHEWQTWRRSLYQFAQQLFKAPESKLAIRVDCGGYRPYTDKDGNVWLPDEVKAAAASLARPDGMTIERYEDYTVPDVAFPEIFRNERYSMSEYEFTLPNGRYTIRLHFAETFDGIYGPGDRVFSFAVQGQPAVKDFDIYKEAGGAYKAIQREYRGVVVNDGKLRITFTPQIENPAINGIEIFAE